MSERGAPISTGEADFLYRLPKQLAAGVQWSYRQDGSRYLAVPVLAEDGTPMTLRGWIGENRPHAKRRRYSFALLVRNSIVVRRWDDKSGHLDPLTQKRMKGPHKHYPDERFGDSPTYPTEDVRIGDPDGALLDFLKECKIEVGRFPIHTQMKVDDFDG